jgi:hypothetical protein
VPKPMAIPDSESLPWSTMVTRALRYREPRRLAYNLVLAVIRLAHFLASGLKLLFAGRAARGRRQRD